MFKFLVIFFFAAASAFAQNPLPYFGFDRSFARPLDASSVWTNQAGLFAYATNSPKAYPGQVLALVTGTSNTLYILDANNFPRIVSGGAGSGFPLTNNVSAGFFSISNLVNVTASNFFGDGSGVTNVDAATLGGVGISDILLRDGSRSLTGTLDVAGNNVSNVTFIYFDDHGTNFTGTNFLGFDGIELTFNGSPIWFASITDTSILAQIVSYYSLVQSNYDLTVTAIANAEAALAVATNFTPLDVYAGATNALWSNFINYPLLTLFNSTTQALKTQIDTLSTSKADVTALDDYVLDTTFGTSTQALWDAIAALPSEIPDPTNVVAKTGDQMFGNLDMTYNDLLNVRKIFIGSAETNVLEHNGLDLLFNGQPFASLANLPAAYVSHREQVFIGGSATLTLSNTPYAPEAVFLFLNSGAQISPNNYSLTSSNQITLNFSTTTNDIVYVKYLSADGDQAVYVDKFDQYFQSIVNLYGLATNTTLIPSLSQVLTSITNFQFIADNLKYSGYRDEYFTGGPSSYTLEYPPLSESSVFVFLNSGAQVVTNDYTVVGTTLSLNFTTTTNDALLVKYLANFGNSATGLVSVGGGGGSGAGFPLTNSPFANAPGSNTTFGVFDFGFLSFLGSGSQLYFNTNQNQLYFGSEPVGSGFGSGFPLTANVSAANFNITNVNTLRSGTSIADELKLISSTGGVGTLVWNGQRLLINSTVVGSGFGSINRVSAPTNQAGALGLSLPDPAILTLVPGTNMSLQLSQINSTNVQVQFSAVSAIPGPPGADGLGTNFFYIGNYEAGKITAAAGATVAAFGGQVWLTTNVSYTIPVGSTPVSNDLWSIWIAKGQDGEPGLDGLDGLNITIVPLFTNNICLTTNNIFPFNGSLWLPKADYCPAPAPINTNVSLYVQLVARGADAVETNQVLQSLTWAGIWNPSAFYPSNSVVAITNVNPGLSPRGVYLATDDVAANVGPYPGIPPWVLLFRDGQQGTNGVAGAPGADGIGNLLFDDYWLNNKPYAVNTLVAFTNPFTSKISLYRARDTLAAGGLNPASNSNTWQELISSARDAQVLQWVWRGTYQPLEIYNKDDLVRFGPKIYYSKFATPFSGISPTVVGGGAYWEELLRDGTSVASNLVYRGSYSGAGVYCVGDSVTYQGSLWVVTNACVTNITPTSPSANWFQLVSKGDTGPMGPASTNIVFEYYVTNVTFIATQELVQVFQTNIVNITNTSFQTFQTNLFNITNIQNITFNTQGVNRITGFGVTNETPTALSFTLGSSFQHTIDGSYISTIRLSTNFAAAGSGGGGTGIVSGSFFEIDNFGGLTPRDELIPFDEVWYYDDDGHIAPR
jgi:hypothetical protein